MRGSRKFCDIGGNQGQRFEIVLKLIFNFTSILSLSLILFTSLSILPPLRHYHPHFSTWGEQN